jgi:hypothetical protein
MKNMNVIGKMFKDEKKEVTIERNFHLLPKVVHIFEVLEFATV